MPGFSPKINVVRGFSLVQEKESPSPESSPFKGEGIINFVLPPGEGVRGRGKRNVVSVFSLMRGIIPTL